MHSLYEEGPSRILANEKNDDPGGPASTCRHGPYAFAQILEQSIKATNSIDDGTLADHMHKATFKTTVGDVKFGPDGEWEKGRLLTVQHHDIKGTDIMQTPRP